MKRFMAIRGEDQGIVGFEVDLGQDHKLIRHLSDGALLIIYEGNLIEVTPEIDSVIMGSTLEQRQSICDEMNKG